MLRDVGASGGRSSGISRLRGRGAQGGTYGQAVKLAQGSSAGLWGIAPHDGKGADGAGPLTKRYWSPARTSTIPSDPSAFTSQAFAHVVAAPPRNMNWSVERQSERASDPSWLQSPRTN